MCLELVSGVVQDVNNHRDTGRDNFLTYVSTRCVVSRSNNATTLRVGISTTLSHDRAYVSLARRNWSKQAHCSRNVSVSTFDAVIVVFNPTFPAAVAVTRSYPYVVRL